MSSPSCLSMLRVAVAGSLIVAAVEVLFALAPARRASAPLADLFWQVTSLLLLAGVLLGLVEWAVVRFARKLSSARARDAVYAASISAAPSALWVSLGAERWRATGTGAHVLLVGGFVLAQLAAYGAARALSAWRTAPLERSRQKRLGLALLAGFCVGALYLGDRTILPRLYPQLHAALALLTLYAAQALALALADVAHSSLGRTPARFAGRLLLFAIVVPGVPSLARLGRDPALRFVLAEHTNVTGRALALGRSRLDRDGDGHSRWLGGGDCDDGDPRIWPGALDVPENGRDEDCSGADLRLEDLVADRAAAPPPVRGRFNVLLVTVDALRADRLGAYGHGRATSPHVDRLAARSLLFARAYAQSNNTAASIPSLHTGRYASTSPWSFGHPRSVGPGWAYLTDAPNVTLAELLRDAGWSTLFLAGRGPLVELGLDQGFGTVRTRLEDQSAALETHVEGLGERPWFAWLHFDEPHAPYEAHPGFDFGSSELERYDSEIAFVDRRIGAALEWLARTGRADSTIVIVTADHGEEFGDHGGGQHASTLYEEQIHVPLIVSVPGVPARRVDQPAELTGILPTVLSVLGIPIPDFVDGKSLFGLLEPGEAATAYSEHYNGSILQRALVTPRWKLIGNVAANTLELYDLERDPRERENRVNREPEIREELRRQLDTASERRVLLSLARARRYADEPPDTLARLLPTLGRPELVRESADVLAARGAGATELATLARRRDLPSDLRIDLARALERVGGVWGARGLVWLAADPDAPVASAASASLGRITPSTPHPYKWPERSESAPEVSHLAFGTRHGDWQIIDGVGPSERHGVFSTARSSGPRTRVAFWIPPSALRPGQWVLELAGWADEAVPRQAVSVLINGRAAGELALEPNLTQSSVVFDSGLLAGGANIVELGCSSPERPVRLHFAMLFPALPGALDLLVGATTSRVEWKGDWERLGLWRGTLFRHSKGARAELVVPFAPSDGAHRLRFEVAAVDGTAVIAASANDRALGQIEVGDTWKLAELAVPAGFLVRGSNRLVFELSSRDPKREPVVRWHAVNLSPSR